MVTLRYQYKDIGHIRGWLGHPLKLCHISYNSNYK